MNRRKLDWLNILNRLDMATKIYRINRCVCEVVAWLAEKTSQPDN